MTENSPYIVSARKYRPATFNTVVGQKALTATLKNAIKTNRLAQAYLFCGPRGVGKTSCARIFAKTINCQNPTPDGEACGECESCKAIERGNSFNLVELDAASNNSVDDIRSITEQVYVPAQNGQYRVFIIDEVHMLSNSAFNAFLKTLEEPPKNVVFILATTEKHKVIPTILSRCQIYDFKRITPDDMVEHLENVARQEGIHTEREGLAVIALKADGAMRDALSIFDQVAASSQGNVTYQNTVDNLNVLDYEYYFRLVDVFREGDVATALMIYKEIRDKGFDSQFFINGLASHIRDLMVSVDPRTHSLLEVSEETAKRYTVQSRTLPLQWYYAAMKLLNDCDYNYRLSNNKRLLVEITLIRLCQLLQTGKNPFEEPERQRLSDVSGKVPATANTSSVPLPGANTPSQTSTPKVEEPTAKSPDITSTNPNINVVSDTRNPAYQRRSVRPGRPSSFRISATSDKKEDVAEKMTGKFESFTYDQFLTAWNEFATQNPSLQILVTAMRSGAPTQISETEFKFVVDHPGQRQAFEMSMGQLVSYLRERLRNDKILLKVDVSDRPVENRQMMPKDFLKQVVDNNEALADFLNKIDAELI